MAILISSPSEETAHPELGALARLARAGVRVAPCRVVGAAAEESFYRLNNLPAQLAALFADLDLADPDEDDLEERAPEAQELLRAHFLLDEFVDLFYGALSGLPARLRVRRVDDAQAAGRVVNRGRPALLALKETWADDWAFGALWARVDASASIALAARPVLVTAAGLVDAGDAEAARASALLGRSVRLLHDPEHGVTGVRFG
jgi:hypothetical protein